MYEPKDKDEVSVNGVRFTKDAPTKPPSHVGPYGLMTQEDLFRNYILNSSMVAFAHGVRVVTRDNKRFVEVNDLQKVQSQPEWKKVILREFFTKGAV